MLFHAFMLTVFSPWGDLNQTQTGQKIKAVLFFCEDIKTDSLRIQVLISFTNIFFLQKDVRLDHSKLKLVSLW